MVYPRAISTAVLTLITLTTPLKAQDREKEEDNQQAERQAWVYSQRAYPRTSIPAGARLNAIREIERTDTAVRARRRALAAIAGAGNTVNPALTTDSANWSLIGPQPTDAGTSAVTAGRV